MAEPSNTAAGETAATCSTSEVPDSQHMGAEVAVGSAPQAYGLSSDSERAHGSCAALSQLPQELSSPRALGAMAAAQLPATSEELPPPAAEASGDPVPTGTLGKPALHNGRILSHGVTAPPEPTGESVSASEGPHGGHQEAPSAPPLRNIQRIRSLMDPRAPGLSMHGEEAVRRQGMSELIFFAAVGDMQRCKKIAEKYKLEVCSVPTAPSSPAAAFARMTG